MREPPPADVLRWIEGLPEEMQERLLELHLIDQARVAAARSVDRLVQAWEQAMRSRGDSEHHVVQQAARVRRVLAGAHVLTWAEVSSAAVENFLAGLRERGLGPKTSNHLLGATRAFGRWLVREGLASSNPLQHAQPVRAQVDVRRRRRALSREEGARLLAVTRNGPSRLGSSGPARALLYRLALETGLRPGEISRLRVCDLRLRETQPTVRVYAASSKHRTEDVLPLRAALAAELERVVAGRLPAALVWHGAPRRKWAAMLREDLEAASIPTAGDDGEIVDFYALRHTFATWLAIANVPPKVAQALMRHCTITLTLDVYAHVGRAEQAEALRALPELGNAAF